MALEMYCIDGKSTLITKVANAFTGAFAPAAPAFALA